VIRSAPRIVKLASEYFSGQGLPNVSKRARVSKELHLRIQKPAEELERFFDKARIGYSTDNVPTLSGKFTSYRNDFPEDFEVEELRSHHVFVLSNFAKKSRISQKQLIPQTFGIVGQPWNRDDLVRHLKETIPDTFDDVLLTSFLVELVDVAAGVKDQVDPDIMEEIDADTRRIAGIDFGEVLTPIVLADDNDVIEFPVGNEMLSDVQINGKNFSVKSATGSGTSFRAIQGMMDDMQDIASEVFDPEELSIYEFYRKFIDTKGKNVDKIIAASAHIATPEHEMIAQLIGKEDFGYDDLVEYVQKFDEYADFLEAVEPISKAGNRARPVGLPQDAMFYLGRTDKEPKKRQAGKPSWDADSGRAGANIMVYIMGTAFLAHSKQEIHAAKFSEVIKKIMNEADAYLAKIDITPAGEIKLSHKKFSDIEFDFQYHAPSHIPGNNLPGFYIVLD